MIYLDSQHTNNPRDPTYEDNRLAYYYWYFSTYEDENHIILKQLQIRLQHKVHMAATKETNLVYNAGFAD
jgi:hypothetical protein